MIPASSFFTTRSQIYTDKNKSNKPLLTTYPTLPYSIAPSRVITQDYKLLWLRFKQTPELVSTIQIPITDILGERVMFYDTDDKPLNHLQEKKAKKFWRDNTGKEVISSFLFDAFLTGDSYLWKGKPTHSEVVNAVKEVLSKQSHILNELQMKELAVKAIQDEHLKATKKIDYVAASTVHIIHDETEYYGYEQIVNAKHAFFTPEEIIHYRYMTINGQVNGFSPAEALIHEMMLLLYVKENMRAWLENGGSPDKVFILPNEIANSPNHEFLVNSLKKYKRVQNRHGNMVFTGEVDIQDLQGNPKDMEFKELALYITSNLAFAWGIPTSRIPYLIGSAATSGDTGDVGYWNKISFIQDTLEDLLNSQLFEEMGWHIRFNRKYKQDEVRDAQTAMMKADAVSKYQEILANIGFSPTKEKILALLGWHSEDIEEGDVEFMAGGSYNQGLQPGKQVNSESGKNKKDFAKSTANKRNDQNEALYKP